MGRTITFRKLTAIAWTFDADGSAAGLIKVEVFKDAAHVEPLGKPEYYFGSIAEPNRSDKGAYYDAKRIVEYGTKLTPKIIAEISKSVVK